MDSGGRDSPVSSISDWDRPFSDQEIEAIDAAIQSASSSSSASSSHPVKRRHAPSSSLGRDDDGPAVRRRLPHSIGGLGKPTATTTREEGGSMLSPSSFSLSPCTRSRAYNSYHSVYKPKLTMRYPAMSFRGRTVYSRTVNEVEKSARELQQIIESKRAEVPQVVLGFDIEWKPTFKKGVPPSKAAVMQICVDAGHCYVMHIIHSGIPQSLRSLLEDPTTLKVGVGIANDAHKVVKDYNVSIKDLEDLSPLANRKLGGDSKKWWGLASLCEMVVCRQLPKPGKIRLGNWETNPLSKGQLEYAATDAFASWFLYEALKSLPDPPDNKSEEPEQV